MVVVEDVVVGRVEAGLDAVPHHLTGPGRRLELLDLQPHTEAGAHTLIHKHREGCGRRDDGGGGKLLPSS